MSVDYYFQKHQRIIESARPGIQGNLTQLVNRILERDSLNRMFFTGVGKNAHVAHLAASTFNSLGIPSGVLDTQHAMHGDLGQVCGGDLVIALSKSGETQELLDLLTQLRARQQYTILIHSNPRNAALALVDQSILIPVKHEADDHSIVPTASLVAFLIFLQSVACEVAQRLNLGISDFVFNHPGGSIGKTYYKRP